MFNFKKIIIYSLSMIIPYISSTSAKPLEADIYDYTTTNNPFRFPVITSWSKDQLNCGTCGYFAMSRILEFYSTYVTYKTTKKEKNYDISIDWILDIYLSSQVPTITSICCTGERCNCEIGEDFLPILKSLQLECNKPKYNVEEDSKICLMESQWCPYSYGYGTPDINIPINKICSAYHWQNAIKIDIEFGEPVDILIPTLFDPSGYTKRDIYNTIIMDKFAPIYCQQDGSTYKNQLPYSASVYMPLECAYYISIIYETEPFTLITSTTPNCIMTNNDLNHAVTLVGIGYWPIEGDYKGQKYAKILDSHGTASSIDNFFYVLLEDPGLSVWGPLNIYRSLSFMCIYEDLSKINEIPDSEL